MRYIPLYMLLAVQFILTSLECQGQTLNEKRVRHAARSGQFYPGDKQALSSMIGDFLEKAEKVVVNGEIVGLWVPHAGYMFSGQVAANAYCTVHGSNYDVVIVIGPSHYEPIRGASIGDWDIYRTPMGDVKVDTELAQKIRDTSSLVNSVPSAHKYEHSVEVQIPFIQTVLPGVPIVPMVIGQLSMKDSKKIAQALVKAVQGKKVLFIASSDMSHFPSYKDAYEVDLLVMDAVADFDVKKVYNLNRSLMKKNIPGLECVLCGQGALTTVMMATMESGAKESRALPYANSGDIYGERHRVVGYGAAIFYRNVDKEDHGGSSMLEEIDFSDREMEKMFRIAREHIISALKKTAPPQITVDEKNLLLKRGVFVTLMNHGRLRGCIGQFEPVYPLHEIVSKMAVTAATQDYRFISDPVTLDEMDKIEIKISVLSELKKIDSIDEIEVGKHGIWVKHEGRSGTYLPEVATELGWNRIEFLEHCCVEKAGLPRDAWKTGADIFIYTSQVLNEKEH